MLSSCPRSDFVNLMQRLSFGKLPDIFRSDYFLPVLFLFFLFVAGTSLWNQPFDEVGDEALIGLQTVRAGQFAEGVGPYSRGGFHHPGPVSFYIYAAAERLFPFILAPGQRYRFVQFLLNAALLTWSFSLLRQLLPGRSALFYLAFFLVSIAPVYPVYRDFWFSIWGPLVLIIPYVLFFVSYTGLNRGRLNHLLPGTVAAVFILHNHVSGITLLAPLALVAFWKLFRLRLQWAPGRHSLISVGIAVMVLVITSIPPLVDEFAGTGNLSNIYRYFTGHGSASRRFDIVLVYLTGYYLDPVRPLITMNPILWFGILTGLPLLVWDRLDPIWRSLHANLMLVFSLSLVAAMRISGDLVPHLFWHLYPFVAFHLLLGAVSIALLIKIRLPEPRLVVLQSALVLLALVVTLYRPDPLPAGPTTIEKVMKEIRSSPGPYRLVFPFGSADHDRWVEAAGLALKIVREGGSYCVDEEWSFMFPHGSTCADDFSGTTLRLTSSDSGDLLVRREDGTTQ